MKIDETKCIGCCSCMAACPQHAISYGDGKCKIDKEKCINCGSCVVQCPMGAISE